MTDNLGGVTDNGTRTRIDGIGLESVNAETPTASNWVIGDVVEFKDTGDGLGDGTNLLARIGSTWLQLSGSTAAT